MPALLPVNHGTILGALRMRQCTKELLESGQSYGLEYVVGGRTAGFILGTSMLFHYGRTFEINDLAVAPEYQRRGIGAALSSF